MSAFIVSYEHINAMLGYAAANQMHFHWDIAGQTAHYDPRCEEDAQTLGAVLLQENVRSILARYSQDKAEQYVDLLCGYRYRLTPISKTISAVQAIKACQCFDYQACETNDWTETFAHRICEGIKSEAIGNLPGYTEAQWEIN